MDVRKLAELVAKVKRSMWGKSGLTCELERNMYLAENLIAHGVTVQEWISVKDRLPEKDGQYLVFQKHTYGTYTAVLRFAKDGRKVDKYDFHRGWKNVWYRYDSEWGHITIDDVTHWMPLPEAPKGE